ncbi:MAG: hypothetical protein U0746_19500 [Gemmataceae bacterium]
MRRRNRAFALTAVLVLLATAIYGYVWVRRVVGYRIAPGNYGRVEVGMSRADVQRAMGWPRHSSIGPTDCWQGTNGVVLVGYDQSGRVRQKSFGKDPDLWLRQLWFALSLPPFSR